MEWIQRLNDAMSYVEENLTGEISLEGAARRAACSAYHFQRMFPYMTGISFSEYVRRRRMTAAAMDLAEGAKSSTQQRVMATTPPRPSTGRFRASTACLPAPRRPGAPHCGPSRPSPLRFLSKEKTLWNIGLRNRHPSGWWDSP